MSNKRQKLTPMQALSALHKVGEETRSIERALRSGALAPQVVDGKSVLPQLVVDVMGDLPTMRKRNSFLSTVLTKKSDQAVRAVSAAEANISVAKVLLEHSEQLNPKQLEQAKRLWKTGHDVVSKYMDRADAVAIKEGNALASNVGMPEQGKVGGVDIHLIGEDAARSLAVNRAANPLKALHKERGQNALGVDDRRMFDSKPAPHTDVALDALGKEVKASAAPQSPLLTNALKGAEIAGSRIAEVKAAKEASAAFMRFSKKEKDADTLGSEIHLLQSEINDLSLKAGTAKEHVELMDEFYHALTGEDLPPTPWQKERLARKDAVLKELELKRKGRKKTKKERAREESDRKERAEEAQKKADRRETPRQLSRRGDGAGLFLVDGHEVAEPEEAEELIVARRSKAAAQAARLGKQVNSRIVKAKKRLDKLETVDKARVAALQKMQESTYVIKTERGDLRELTYTELHSLKLGQQSHVAKQAGRFMAHEIESVESILSSKDLRRDPAGQKPKEPAVLKLGHSVKDIPRVEVAAYPLDLSKAEPGKKQDKKRTKRKSNKMLDLNTAAVAKRIAANPDNFIIVADPSKNLAAQRKKEVAQAQHKKRIKKKYTHRTKSGTRYYVTDMGNRVYEKKGK